MKILKFLFLIVITSNIIHAQNSNTKRVAVLDVVDKEQCFNRGVKALIQSELTQGVTCTSGYEGYDRIDISSIMTELEFQQSGMINANQINRIGKLSGVDYILVSEIAKLDKNQVIITAKIIDVETAKQEKNTDITTVVDIIKLKRDCKSLVNQLLQIKQQEREIPFICDEQDAEFNGGGLKTFYVWTNKNIVYPLEDLENNICGTVISQFTISKDGQLKNIKIIKSPAQNLSNEVIRVLTNSPKWAPAKMNGFAVDTRYIMPIRFTIHK